MLNVFFFFKARSPGNVKYVIVLPSKGGGASPQTSNISNMFNISPGLSIFLGGYHPNGNGCYFNFSEIVSASASVM